MSAATTHKEGERATHCQGLNMKRPGAKYIVGMGGWTCRPCCGHDEAKRLLAAEALAVATSRATNLALKSMRTQLAATEAATWEMTARVRQGMMQRNTVLREVRDLAELTQRGNAEIEEDLEESCEPTSAEALGSPAQESCPPLAPAGSLDAAPSPSKAELRTSPSKAELRTQLAAARQQLDAQQLQLDALQQQRDALRHTRRRRSTELSVAQSVLADADAELTAKDEQLTAKDEQLAAAQQQHATQLAAAQQQHQADLDAAEDEKNVEVDGVMLHLVASEVHERALTGELAACEVRRPALDRRSERCVVARLTRRWCVRVCEQEAASLAIRNFQAVKNGFKRANDNQTKMQVPC
jgi:hypothetical protein